MNKQNCKTFLRLLEVACFFVFVSTYPGYASEKQIDAVWVEPDGIRHEIFYSEFSGGQWSDPVQLTNDYFDNLHPVIDRDSHGKRWVFWTASDTGKLTLHYTSSTEDGWADIQDVPVELHSSIAPSVVIDGHDVLWLFWSGNTGGQDDIYVIKYRNGEWGQAVTVHADNEVPDILPTATLGDNGELVVTWKTFQDGGYTVVQSSWNGQTWSAPERVEQENKISAETFLEEKKITVPVFLKDDDRAFIRMY